MQLLQFFAALYYQIPFQINWLKLVQQVYYSVDKKISGLVVYWGAYNRTYYPAHQQHKFYLLRQPSAAEVSEIRLPESTKGEGVPEYKMCVFIVYSDTVLFKVLWPFQVLSRSIRIN